jgi:hypothetical protein
MDITQGISVGNLLLDTSNYRIVKQASQKGARDAIIAEQGKKLIKLAEDIIEHGLNPFDLPMVIDAEDGNQNYIVVEGNRRLTAISLLLDPELAKGTPVYKAFSGLSKKYTDAIPKVLNCVIAPNKSSALVWINRKHANGLEGAGTEPWTAMAKARADVEQGIPRPDLDVVNFVLSNPSLDEGLRVHLEGAGFSLTTLQRLVTTKELQDATGLTLDNGELVSSYDKNWLQKVLTDLITTIANGERAGVKFTERNIDSKEKRQAFVADLVADHHGKKKASKEWIVTGNPKAISATTKTLKISSVKGTPSTEDQPNLIPRKFKLELPAGKINDVFVELKKLDVVTHRHAASVLFRVFYELSVDSFLKSQNSMPAQGKKDSLLDKLNLVIGLLEKNNLMSKKELAGTKTELADKNSLLSPVTLNAYVHSEWMNPDPLRLKITWNNAQLMIERIWQSVNKAGQNGI